MTRIVGYCPGFQILQIPVDDRGKKLGIDVSEPCCWRSASLQKAFKDSDPYYLKVDRVKKKSTAEQAGMLVGDVFCSPLGNVSDNTWRLLQQSYPDISNLLKTGYLYVARQETKKESASTAFSNGDWTLSRDMADKVASRKTLNRKEKRDLLNSIRLHIKRQHEQERNSVLQQLPIQVRNSFGEIGVARWSDSMHYPVLAMNPFHVQPGPVREKWFKTFEKVRFLVLFVIC
jgi:hypothetical protein